ncbi:hypothetical protein TNCV_2836071 [Trichonephila clavipes]|nr:hypothetical protein TNCV_2836071 [Trichonephila clavipes]
MATGSFTSPNYPSSQSEVLRDHYNLQTKDIDSPLFLKERCVTHRSTFSPHRSFFKVLDLNRRDLLNERDVIPTQTMGSHRHVFGHSSHSLDLIS